MITSLGRLGLSRSPPSRGRGLKLLFGRCNANSSPVAPLAGAWIETLTDTMLDVRAKVAPLAGAWIETSAEQSAQSNSVAVAPLAGAWIETRESDQSHHSERVAPLAGAWIETL